MRMDSGQIEWSLNRIITAHVPIIRSDILQPSNYYKYYWFISNLNETAVMRNSDWWAFLKVTSRILFNERCSQNVYIFELRKFILFKRWSECVVFKRTVPAKFISDHVLPWLKQCNGYSLWIPKFKMSESRHEPQEKCVPENEVWIDYFQAFRIVRCRNESSILCIICTWILIRIWYALL